ncbi:hypothetical protein MRB53_039682 [Persea americana]|nr:hypothetical protein MRB53_039682 [Persea americana]
MHHHVRYARDEGRVTRLQEVVSLVNIFSYQAKGTVSCLALIEGVSIVQWCDGVVVLRPWRRWERKGRSRFRHVWLQPIPIRTVRRGLLAAVMMTAAATTQSILATSAPREPAQQ